MARQVVLREFEGSQVSDDVSRLVSDDIVGMVGRRLQALEDGDGL